MAAVQDLERACQVEAEEQRGREPVDRVAAVGDGDAPVPPAVAAALPPPAARQWVDRPLLEQAFANPDNVRPQSVDLLHLHWSLNLAVWAADMSLHKFDCGG
ncbi:MAG: hypothetical protein ACXVZ3_02310 [Gaiellaceae bacterium]